MTDTNINSYLIDFSDKEINLFINRAKDNVKEWCLNQIRKWCDCKRIGKDGRRLNQTNDYRYRYEVSTVWYVINNIEDETLKEMLMTELINNHKANLEFEAINGFEYTPKKTVKVNSTNKPKREKHSDGLTAEQRKQKARMEKIRSLNIRIKPIV